MSSPSPQELVHAYRHLYRGVLHAIQYAKPGRFVARDQLRNAFRKDNPSNFNREKIERTLEFLRLATRESGLEHRILKNLIHMEYWQGARYLEYVASLNAYQNLHLTVYKEVAKGPDSRSDTDQKDF